MRYKGISHSLEILIGLIVCVFILMIAFKLLGIYSAYQYEQQAQITAKNLQTAMNRVCVSGQPMEVNVNFPQELRSGGTAPDPISIIWRKVTGGKDVSVTKALRYMTAVQSYGDPWYVLYYEDFPQGEDSGWSGWSEVAAMRISSAYFKTLDTAICIATAAVPFYSDMKRAGTAIAKYGRKGLDDVVEGLRRSSNTNKLIKQTDDALEIAKRSKYSTGERMWMNNIGRKIITKSKKAKGSLGKIFRRLNQVSTLDVKKHITAFRKSEGFLDDSADGISDLLRVHRGEAIVRNVDNEKAILSKIDNLKHGGITEKEYVNGLKKLKGSDKLKEIYKNSEDLMRSDFGFRKGYLKTQYGRTDDEIEFLKNLIGRVGEGKIGARDIKLLKKMTSVDRSVGGKTINGFENFVDAAESTQKLQKSVNNLNYLAKSGSLFEKSKYPIAYSRHISDAVDSKSARLPALAAYTHFHHAGLRKLRKVAYREGRWIVTAEGGAFIFNNVISLFDQAEFKFSPCSDHALCLKSALNPSITIYPLDECKEAGIDYIELDKHPVGGDAGDWSTTQFDNLGNWITGDKPTSKFYTASPCGGKLKIEKTTCECHFEMIPYLDRSSIDVYLTNCTITDKISDSKAKLKCELYKNMTYINEIEKLTTFEVTADVSYDADSGRHDISFNFTDDFTDVENFVGKYFGSYYKSLNEEYEDQEKEPLDLTCKDAVVEYKIGKKIECTPIPLPSVAFEYSTCGGASKLWLECVNWTEGEETTLKKEGSEKDEEVPAKKWCCKQWNMSYYPYGIKGEKNKTKEIINVSSCDDYLDVIGGGRVKDIIDNTKTAVKFYHTIPDSENPIIEDESDYFSSLITPKTESAGDIASVLWNARPGAILGIITGHEEEMVKNIPIVYTIVTMSEPTLPEDVDLTDENVAELYNYNLPTEEKTDCLKATYIAKDDATKGFCYTSPMGWANAESAGWMALSTAVDVGVELVIDFFTVGSCYGVGSLTSCMLGNLIMWYGESAVSEKREGAYWPNNVFFGNYYTK